MYFIGVHSICLHLPSTGLYFCLQLGQNLPPLRQSWFGQTGQIRQCYYNDTIVYTLSNRSLWLNTSYFMDVYRISSHFICNYNMFYQYCFNYVFLFFPAKREKTLEWGQKFSTMSFFGPRAISKHLTCKSWGTFVTI